MKISEYPPGVCRSDMSKGKGAGSPRRASNRGRLPVAQGVCVCVGGGGYSDIRRLGPFLGSKF